MLSGISVEIRAFVKTLRWSGFLFADSRCLPYNERFHAGALLLNTVGEIAGAVLEQHNEAKGENDEQDEPKKPAQKRHATG